ncbi:MAG: hypothetical protein EOM83_13210 [Clostridia bacterium]|nr:hypothetical protein [Clostridia bacterium]
MTRLIFTGIIASKHFMFELAPVDIVHAEACANHSQIFVSGKPPLIVLEDLIVVEDKLSKFQFLKISNSTIINLEHITHISFGNETIVSLSDNYQVAVDKNVAQLMKKHLHK